MVKIGSGGGADSNSNIKVAPGVWTLSSQTVGTSNSASQDIQAAVMITLNDLIDTLNVFTYVQGASDLAQAVSDFGYGIENMLGCVAVDLAVVGSGLAAAAQAFGSLDSSLSTMFNSLNQDLAYYTNSTTLTTATAASYRAYQPSSSSGGGFSVGNFFGNVWHDVTSWGSDIYHGVDSGLQHVGVPAAICVVVAGVVIVLYYVAIAVPAAAAAA